MSYAIKVFILCVVAVEVSNSAFAGESKGDFKDINGAPRVFALAEGKASQNLLLRLKGRPPAPPTFSQLHTFEQEFPKLSVEEQFDAIILVIARYGLSGEYYIRVIYLATKDKEKFKVFLKMFNDLDKKRLRDFVYSYGREYNDFARDVHSVFGVKLVKGLRY